MPYTDGRENFSERIDRKHSDRFVDGEAIEALKKIAAIMDEISPGQFRSIVGAMAVTVDGSFEY